MAPSLSWFLVYVLSFFTLVDAANVRGLLNERAAIFSTVTRTTVLKETIKTTTTLEATKTVTSTVLATSTPT